LALSGPVISRWVRWGVAFSVSPVAHGCRDEQDESQRSHRDMQLCGRRIHGQAVDAGGRAWVLI
jgi:hypothetical protein